MAAATFNPKTQTYTSPRPPIHLPTNPSLSLTSFLFQNSSSSPTRPRSHRRQFRRNPNLLPTQAPGLQARPLSTPSQRSHKRRRPHRIENDAVLVITNANSEWSETIQNLISPTSQKPPISLSPTSSSSSSFLSLIASTSSACSKLCIIDATPNISEGKSQVALEILTRLARFSNPTGNSEERLMSYWVSALKSINEIFDYSHVPGRAVLHRGRHRHGARATTSGHRINLLLWCRRNTGCE
uniref:Uncharacterized protein n=1 Tax=Quercus lobata TaxID=97700 RepID=A0A7N2MQF9_QUELO